MTTKLDLRVPVAYAPPRLVVYGGMADLTASGSATGGENVNAKAMSKAATRRA